MRGLAIYADITPYRKAQFVLVRRWVSGPVGRILSLFPHRLQFFRLGSCALIASQIFDVFHMILTSLHDIIFKSW